LTLYALRQTVGDPVFFRTLRTFHDTFGGRNATSADFIAVAARVSGRPSVRPLLRAWLYDQAVPTLPGRDRTVAAGAPTAAASPPALGIGVRRR
jgi:aminopeptidase N